MDVSGSRSSNSGFSAHNRLLVGLSFFHQIGNHVRVDRGDVMTFSRIVSEIEQQRWMVLLSLLTVAVRPARHEVRFVAARPSIRPLDDTPEGGHSHLRRPS